MDSPSEIHLFCSLSLSNDLWEISSDNDDAIQHWLDGFFSIKQPDFFKHNALKMQSTR